MKNLACVVNGHEWRDKLSVKYTSKAIYRCKRKDCTAWTKDPLWNHTGPNYSLKDITPSERVHYFEEIVQPVQARREGSSEVQRV